MCTTLTNFAYAVWVDYLGHGRHTGIFKWLVEIYGFACVSGFSQTACCECPDCESRILNTISTHWDHLEIPVSMEHLLVTLPFPEPKVVIGRIQNAFPNLKITYVSLLELESSTSYFSILHGHMEDLFCLHWG
jgi:hypothetical protein